MAQTRLIFAVILAIVAVVLIGISATIAGIVSTRVPGGDIKTRILAIAALNALTVLFAIVTGVLGILYGRARSQGSKSTKGLGIAFLVLAVITLSLYITVVALSLTARAAPELNQTNKNALVAAVIMVAVGFVSLTVSTILFFTITKGKKGKEALEALRFRRSGVGTSTTMSKEKT